MRRGAYRAALEATSLDPVLSYQVRPSLERAPACLLTWSLNVSAGTSRQLEHHGGAAGRDPAQEWLL